MNIATRPPQIGEMMGNKLFTNTNQSSQIERNILLAQKHVMQGIYYYNELHNFEEAIREFAEAVSLDPYCADAYANCAVALQAIGHVRPALSNIHFAINLKSDEPVWYGVRALLRVHSNDWLGVINDTNFALLSQDPDVEWRSQIIGLQIWAKQQYGDESWTDDLPKYTHLMKERAKNNPAILEAAPLALIVRELGMEIGLMSLAYAAMEQESHDEAVEHFTNVLNINSNNSYALLNRGVIFLMKHNLEAALQVFNMAINVDPSFAQPFYFRAITHGLLAEFTKAIKDSAEFIQRGGDPSLVTPEAMGKMHIQLRSK
jgi:tetratricopeptide (TPR) repeat protein